MSSSALVAGANVMSILGLAARCQGSLATLNHYAIASRRGDLVERFLDRGILNVGKQSGRSCARGCELADLQRRQSKRLLKPPRFRAREFDPRGSWCPVLPS